MKPCRISLRCLSLRRKLVSTQMHRVALRYTKAELLTIFAVATTEDVDHRGHYECRGGAIYVWSHPWTNPATRYDSATIGAFYVNWLAECIDRIETAEGFELQIPTGPGTAHEAQFPLVLDEFLRGLDGAPWPDTRAAETDTQARAETRCESGCCARAGREAETPR